MPTFTAHLQPDGSYLVGISWWGTRYGVPVAAKSEEEALEWVSRQDMRALRGAANEREVFMGVYGKEPPWKYSTT